MTKRSIPIRLIEGTVKIDQHDKKPKYLSEVIDNDTICIDIETKKLKANVIKDDEFFNYDKISISYDNQNNTLIISYIKDSNIVGKVKNIYDMSLDSYSPLSKVIVENYQKNKKITYSYTYDPTYYFIIEFTKTEENL